ncbi:hypothetical protein HYW11_02960 [Candidatus Peregrinibacteria bacterium]|nr:hypothetical protein [Candidatus Peregrinibacteria bacterium]
MPSNQHAPATKQDIHLLMEQMGKYYQQTEQRIERLEEEFTQKVDDWKKEIIHEFHVVAENLHYDFKGALNDKIQNHENRIVHLEERVGLAA